jgi:membrane-associated phospholipid phosphatase
MRHQRAFLIPFLTCWFVGLYLVLQYDKIELHSMMNAFQPEWLFMPFFWITNLGDGLSLTILSFLFVLFVSVRGGLFLGALTGLDGLVVQLLKRNVFADMHRPYYFIDQMPDLLLMPGLEMHENFSFPSGHTSAAFAFFFGLSLLMKKDSLKFLCFLLAALIAYSRIFLSQHFMMDLLAGSMIGLILGWIFYVVFEKWVKNDWMKRPLIQGIISS